MNPVQVISFMLLAFACLNEAPSATAAASTTTESNPRAQTTTNSQDLLESSASTTTSGQTTPSITIAPPASTLAPTVVDSDSHEPAVTLIDGFVDADESSTSSSRTASDNNADINADTSTGESSLFDMTGIEGKSIDGSVNENSFDLKEEKSSNLSIDPTDMSAETNVLASSVIEDKQPAPPVNLSAVDKEYVEGRRSEEETLESWRKMNKKLKKGISNIIGSMVPMALNMSQEAKISSNCSGAMLKWVLSMNQLKSWALRMLDATGKPIAGLLEGSMTMFGNFRECLKIRAPDEDEMDASEGFAEYFRGKYCIIQAKPWLPEKDRFYNLNTKIKSLMDEAGETPWYDKTVFEELSEWVLAFNFVNIRFDLCIPSLCTREDIQRAMDYLLKGIDLKARVLRCEMDAPNGTIGAVTSVETGDPEVTEALYGASTAPIDSSTHSFNQLAWILVPIFATAIVSLATCFSMTAKPKKSNKLRHIIKSLSLERSVKSHVNVDYDQLADDKPLALYGMRIVLVLWVILVESAVNLKFEFLRELLMLKDLLYWWPMQVIINSTLQFDSLILLTAFTMGYKNCLNNGIDNARSIFKFVLDKYIRLIPSIMLMVALVILLPLAYRGPVWNDYVTKQSAVCQSTGWLNIVFLQNYLSYKDICLPQTWLLCIEFQLVVLMAPIVYYLNKNYTSNFDAKKRIVIKNINSEKQEIVKLPASRSEDASKPFHWLYTAPGTILAACIVVGLGGSFYNVYYHNLPPSWFYTMADPDSKTLYFTGHMTKLWTHLAVFAMGILAGVECRRAGKNVLRSYKGLNLSNLGNSSSLVKGQTTKSALSLPVTVSQSDESLSNKGSSEMNSSVSINIDSNSHTQDSMASGCRMIQNESKNCNSGKTLTRWITDLIGCAIVIGTMAAIIFLTHDWSLNELPKPLIAGAFDAGSRFLWSLGLIWILYQISVPNKNREFSLLARLLGHPVMVFLGKLSFLIYVIHPFVHTAVLAIQEQPIYSNWIMLIHILIGNITITVLLASFVSLFVEMPCRNLFRRCGTTSQLTTR